MGYTGIDPSIKDLFGPLEPMEGPRSNPCVLCKGAKNLCGKDKCALMVKYYARSKTRSLIDGLDLTGSSPPGVFVGRYGYPKVEVGPLVPPEFGDTSLMDTPEEWVGKSIQDIADFRFSAGPGQVPGGSEGLPERRPDDGVHPGPGAMRELGGRGGQLPQAAHRQDRPGRRDPAIRTLGPPEPLRDHQPEVRPQGGEGLLRHGPQGRGGGDRPLPQGVLISKIQKAFSVGAFGMERNRRLVPTRWSITAVDDTLGKELLKSTKTFPRGRVAGVRLGPAGQSLVGAAHAYLLALRAHRGLVPQYRLEPSGEAD